MTVFRAPIQIGAKCIRQVHVLPKREVGLQSRYGTIASVGHVFDAETERVDQRLALSIVELDINTAGRIADLRVIQRTRVIHTIEVHRGPDNRLITSGVRVLSVTELLETYVVEGPWREANVRGACITP